MAEKRSGSFSISKRIDSEAILEIANCGDQSLSIASMAIPDLGGKNTIASNMLAAIITKGQNNDGAHNTKLSRSGLGTGLAVICNRARG